MEQIVVGVDGSEAAGDALRWAVDEAVRRGDTTVTAVTVLERPDDLRIDLAPVDTRRLPQPIEHRTVEGPPAQALLDAGQRSDLLVVGSRGRGGLAGLLAESVSQQCAEHAVVPLVVVPAAAGATPRQRVVVGVDGSPAADEALRWAAREAGISDAVLEVVHGWQFPVFGEVPESVRTHLTSADVRRMAESTVDDAIAGCGLDGGALVVERVASDLPPAPALLAAAENADLVVVGSRGRHGFAGLLLGSVSQQCLHHTPCPIAIVHSGRDQPGDAGG